MIYPFKDWSFSIDRGCADPLHLNTFPIGSEMIWPYLHFTTIDHGTTVIATLFVIFPSFSDMFLWFLHPFSHMSPIVPHVPAFFRHLLPFSHMFRHFPAISRPFPMRPGSPARVSALLSNSSKCSELPGKPATSRRGRLLLDICGEYMLPSGNLT